MFTIEKDSVLRDGEVIGTLADGVVTLTAPLAPAHKSKLKKELADLGIEVTSFAKAEGEANEADDSSIPPCPPIDSKMGDKTPAVVEWYRDHKPAEYKVKYAGRKTHLGLIS